MRTAHRRQAKAKRRIQADPSAIYKVMSKIQPFTPQEKTTLTLPVRLAFDSFRNGSATKDDFDTLAAMTNICIIRAEEIDQLCVDASNRADTALMRSMHRYKSTGRWGFDGPALQDVGVVVDFYEQLLDMSTPKQMIDAMQLVIVRAANERECNVRHD